MGKTIYVPNTTYKLCQFAINRYEASRKFLANYMVMPGWYSVIMRCLSDVLTNAL